MISIARLFFTLSLPPSLPPSLPRCRGKKRKEEEIKKEEAGLDLVALHLGDDHVVLLVNAGLHHVLGADAERRCGGDDRRRGGRKGGRVSQTGSSEREGGRRRGREGGREGDGGAYPGS
jgi:hypothetical protein